MNFATNSMNNNCISENEEAIQVNSEKEYAFTSGSCAAAAAKAAAYMLLTGKIKEEIAIETPAGVFFNAKIVDIHREEESVSCAVIKDGGKDPDVTTGASICATVSFSNNDEKIFIDGGIGVGRVTKPGLDQPVGMAAINSIPRNMIKKEVSQIMELCDCSDSLSVIISVPGGEQIAEKTFNPRLGILGGISILGTTGLVEPMSTRALLDTIKVELNQKRALGYDIVPVSPGNYGLEFMRKTYDFDLDLSVKSSNYIGDTIDMAVSCGFEKMLLTGHIGKLIKVSGGMMNTHSKEGDCRMELMSSAAILAGADINTARQILDCVSTEAALAILNKDSRIYRDTLDIILDKVMFYLNKRSAGRMNIECMIYSNDFGLLAKSRNVDLYIDNIKNIVMQ